MIMPLEFTETPAFQYCYHVSDQSQCAMTVLVWITGRWQRTEGWCGCFMHPPLNIECLLIKVATLLFTREKLLNDSAAAGVYQQSVSRMF